MLIRYLPLVILTLSLSCSSGEQLERGNVVGNFINLEGADHYTRLDIRDDNTYKLEQSRNYGDVWMYSYGTWEIQRGWLKLYEGTDLEPSIRIEEYAGIDTDTLTIEFTESFLSEFPDLRLRIGLDTGDTEIKNGKLLLDKKRYCNNNGIFQAALNTNASTYQYYPLELNIRANQYFCSLNYILGKRKITIGLGDFRRSNQPLNELVKYIRSDSLLHSVSSQDWIIPHTVSSKK